MRIKIIHSQLTAGGLGIIKMTTNLLFQIEKIFILSLNMKPL